MQSPLLFSERTATDDLKYSSNSSIVYINANIHTLLWKSAAVSANHIIA